jgi:anoctamin-10/anoctamin-7
VYVLDTDYEDSLIAKTFVFQFVNSYSPLFYIAFVKPFIGEIDSCLGGCLVELQTNLSSIFITRLAVGNMTEIGVPLIMARLKKEKETTGSDVDVGEVEKAYMKEDYNVMLGTFNDYAEQTIQFGYATMFVLAYPLSTCLALANNYIGKFFSNA